MNQLKMGAMLSYLSIFISILLALLYTPFMIRILGQAEYGLYSLIGSIAAYFSVMDLGLGNALVRYSARNREIGNSYSASKLNGLFLMLYTVIGLITILVGVGVYNSVDVIFGNGLSGEDIHKAKIMIVILIINFALSFPLSIFNSILRAHEKFVIDKTVSIIRIVLGPLLILPIIYVGYGAVSMVVITTSVNLSCLLFTMIYCFKKLNVSFYFGKMDMRLTREILGYSFLVFLGVVVDQIYWQTDQIILGAVSGTVPVAVYAIAMLFVKLYKQFSTAISGLLLPRISMMVAKNVENKELSNLMIKYGRIQYFIITLILCGYILYGKEFISYWAGPGYDQTYYIGLIILIPLTIPLIQNIGVNILYAKSLQGFRATVLIIIAILNIFVSIPIAKEHGGVGVAVITALTILLGNVIVMNIYYQKKIGLDMLNFWKNILAATLPIVLSLVVGYFISMLFVQESIFYLGIKIVVYTCIHALFIYFIGFNSYEKQLIKSIIARVKTRIM
ncbi:oligosaccharide flippase family protein [Oceanobacillus locisalsi]|uniref:Oligosaccharide flippase family protein n=1 Tax=Oceanobacillus locisalsi TaxID=546107 RepID=A0ABW3N9N8_9BACI